MNEVAVLIAESGARWNDWAKEWCGPSRELILLIQHGQESFAEFRSRIEQGLARVLRRKASVKQVVFVGGNRADTDTLLWRAQLVRSVLRHLSTTARPVRLVLDAGATSELSLRCMKALGAALEDGHGTTSVVQGSNVGRASH